MAAVRRARDAERAVIADQLEGKFGAAPVLVDDRRDFSAPNARMRASSA
ncbi:MAG TPA: hypothetical protein VK438_01660 [Xanthobacteraceae bacterium]|nr:hypothetical protein [Xanthobacteraceae bacterium]